MSCLVGQNITNEGSFIADATIGRKDTLCKIKVCFV